MECYHSLFLRFFVMSTIASINGQGLRSPDKWHNAFLFFQRSRFDIVLLQETHWSTDLELQFKRDWDGSIFFNHGSNHARGVAILVHSRLDHNIRRVRHDDNGRILNLLLDFDDVTLNIINTYAPNTDSERRLFFTILEDFISHDCENIIGGDFNCVSDPRLDKFGGNPNVRQSSSLFLDSINARHGLSDIWRERHKNERNFTWIGRHPADNSLIQTRIDRFFVSRSISPFVLDTSIIPFAHSDHDLITLSLDFDSVQRGPGFWHFNNDLLCDASFQVEIESFWRDWEAKLHTFENPLVWWDKAKHNFKILSIRRAKIRGKLQRHERFQLENKLDRLKEAARNGTDSDVERYLLAKEKQKDLAMKDLEAIKIRAKARFFEEGERSTRYFYSLEKRRKAEHSIKVLTKDNMDTVSDQGQLISETYKFYKSLYSAQPDDKPARDAFLNFNAPKLSESERVFCEAPITLEELTKALNSMENNKSPGFDGLSTNFYKHFWPLLGDKLVIVYNYAFQSGCLSVSQRRGVISLVFKKGDRSLLKNWRPITLLATDYKFLTKALANRLHCVLPSVIHSDQTASVRGRTINDNTRLLHDVVSYANDCNIPLALISVDQLKAFDRVSHEFLFDTLVTFGFGPNFIRWIRVIYNSVSSSVKTNGWLTAFIALERGLRQGCALSMPLYVLTAESLAINIRENPAIHGLRPPDSNAEVKLSQFADDTTLLLIDDQSIVETFCTFDKYERASGARINLSKCKGLWCGAFAWRTDQAYGFDWFNDYIPDKILGQFLGNVDCSKLNWDCKVKKITNIINAWSHRDLSYKGKTLVINGLLTSTLWYCATSLSIPSWAVTQIEQGIYRFFWSGKKPLVNRDILALPLKEGGFNIARLDSKIQALRLNTLRRMLTGEEAHWKHFTAYFLRVSGMSLGKLTLALDYRPRDIDNDIPSFHKELLTAWCQHGTHHSRSNPPVCRTDILKEPLFRNNLISTSNRSPFYRDWVASNLIQLKDICYEVIPGFLPETAIHEILSEYEESEDRTFQQTVREFREIRCAVSEEWKLRIVQMQEPQPNTLQPSFVTPSDTPGNPPVDIISCNTRTFYKQLRKDVQATIPALDYWKRSLQPQPVFNSRFWRNIYSPLVTNKLGDLNWKIVHRVLHTALSLNRMEVLDVPICHKCGAIENLEHLLVDCITLDVFWSQVQIYVDKITNSRVIISNCVKLLGWIPGEKEKVPTKIVDLVNWSITIARYAIYRSAVDFKSRSEVTSVPAIFRAVVKAHIRFQYKLYFHRGKQQEFLKVWCIGQALANVENNQLAFKL